MVSYIKSLPFNILYAFPYNFHTETTEIKLFYVV